MMNKVIGYRFEVIVNRLSTIVLLLAPNTSHLTPIIVGSKI
jgi:hypothetical protein